MREFLAWLVVDRPKHRGRHRSGPSHHRSCLVPSHCSKRGFSSFRLIGKVKSFARHCGCRELARFSDHLVYIEHAAPYPAADPSACQPLSSVLYKNCICHGGFIDETYFWDVTIRDEYVVMTPLWHDFDVKAERDELRE